MKKHLSKGHLLLLFVLGAVMGPVGDFFHVISGTTGYTTRSLIWPIPVLGIPAWVSLEMGLAVLCVGVSHVTLDATLSQGKTRPGEKSAGRVGLGLLLVLVFWATSAFLPWRTGGGKDIVLGLGVLATWWFLERTQAGIVLALMTAMAGTAVEILLVRLDIFYYSPQASNLFGVPTWLPFLYMAASIAIGNFSRQLAK